MRPFFLFVAFAGFLVMGMPARAQEGGLATAHGAITWGGYAQVPTLGARKKKVPTFNEAHQALDDQVGWYSLRLAGPFPAIDANDPGPAGFTGSLIVAEFASLAEARAWADADPYVAAGVYASVDVRPLRITLP